MTKQAENAMLRYRQSLEHALENAPCEVRADAIQDAEEFLGDEMRSMDVGSLTSEQAAYGRFVERFGSPQQLACSYLEQPPLSSDGSGRWKRTAAAVFLVLTLTCGVCYAMLQEPPLLSPFTHVSFQENQVLVEYDGKTSQWIELDDVLVKDIVAWSKTQFGDLWQKRIAEDLVEVLWGMGHRPGKTVQLRLIDPQTREVQVVERARMTADNRSAILDARIRADIELEMNVLTNPIRHFHQGLRDRWAYYPRSAGQVDAAIADLQERLATDSTGIDLLLELRKIVACGIDGHASVGHEHVAGSWKPSGRYLPFLIDSVGERYVAFVPDRTTFLDEDHPFVESIEGVPISEWCEAAAALVPQGSRQMIRQQCLGLLRHIDHWRKEKGMPITSTLRVTLRSIDGSSLTEKTVSTVHQRPRYGDWPRHESRIIDSNVGYLRIKSMDEQAVSDIRTFMAKFKETRGLIVDVRGNGGGSRSALRWLFSYLMSTEDPPRVVNAAKYRLHPDFVPGHLKARFMYPEDCEHWVPSEKTAIRNFLQTFEPQWDAPEKEFSDWHYFVLNRLEDDDIYYYDRRVIVLSDARCFSATDIFLAGLKGWRNVTLVGTPSAGGSARSVTFKLPGTRLNFRLASMASFQPDGKLFDGNGVMPDVIVEPTLDYFIGRSDNVLDEALTIIAN